MLKYIFAILLIGAVWTTVLLLELPMWIAIVSTVVIVAILLTVVIYRVVRAKRAAKEIERALSAQADQHAARARPDLQADIESLKGEFMKAVGALKTSKLGGKRPSEALYALPWYMIIGPPGSGKSTALRNSGLRFPYLSKTGGGAVRGVGGTRNCQWWMTNDAVILDTAGRYTTEDSDRDEWMAFLDLIKRNRSKAPINGVLVAIAVTDLSEVHAEEVVSQAREIRARVDEVMNKLEMVVPVYVLFTKCDLLPGFVETFGDLGGKERGQIWGFTFPASKRIADPGSAFAERFAELASTVERRALRRMTEERRIEGRDKIYEFPQYFEPLKECLSIFVGELCAENIYNESPIMRGCYFTSGTQEGRPIDRIMSNMAQAFGIQPRMSYTAPQVEAKSYFLGDLFSKVIFPDKTLASRTAARIRKQRAIAHAIALVLLLVAIGMAVLPVLSFRDNKAMLENSSAAVEKINEHFAQDEEAKLDPIRIERLLPLRDLEKQLREWEADGAPWLMRMGMYQGKRLYPPVQELYFRAVREELLIPIRDMDIFELKKFVQKYVAIPEPAPEREHRAAKERLRMYLLLTGPVGEGEPGLTEDQQTWLVDRIAELWAEPLELSGDMATKQQMKDVASAYVTILAEDPGKLFERDEKMVKDVRKILLRTDRTQELLNALLAEAEDYPDLADLDLRFLTNSRTALKNDNRKVRKAFTRTAWESYMRDRLYADNSNLLGDEWVLGRSEEKAKEDLERDMLVLRSAYLEAYINEWQRFIGTIYVDAPQGFNEALEMINDLTAGDPAPIKRLCQNLTYHSELLPPPEPEPDPVEEGIGDAAKKLGGQALAKKGGKGGRLAANALANQQGKKEKMVRRDPLLKYEEDVKHKFEKLAGFGFQNSPPAPEGAAPPPPPAVPLDDYQEELKRLRDALKAKIDVDGPDERKALATASKAARTTVDSIINDSDVGEWGPTLEKWLRPPIKELGRIVEGDANATILIDWCNNVVKPFDALADRYPFDAQKRDVELAKFTAYFAPGKGQLWTFYDTVLASRVQKKHGGYVVVTKGAATRAAINPKVAKFFERADDIKKVMFPDNVEDPIFEFDVMIESGTEFVSKTSLEVDGKEIDYRNGPTTWQPMVWPGEGEARGRVRALGMGRKGNLNRDGEWGFFRLIEEGDVTGKGKEVFIIKWDLRTQDAGIVNMRIKPAREDTPMFGTRARPSDLMEMFRHPDLTPPRQLFVGGGSCKGGGDDE